MARPLKPTFDPTQREELRRLTSDGPLEMVDVEGATRMHTSEPDQLRWLLRAEATVLTQSSWQAPPGYRAVPTTTPPLVEIEPDEALRQLGNAWQLISAVAGTPSFATMPDVSEKRLAPRLDSFYQAYQPLMEAYQRSLFEPESVIDEGMCFDIDRLLERGFQSYQDMVTRPPVARAIKQHQTNQNRNRLSLLRYLDSLFAAYPSLYVLHLDMGYSVRHRKTNITYKRLREDINALFYARHANLMWKDDLVGHIWKIEDAPERRFHVHLLLFYDGTTADRHWKDAKRIETRWIHEITNKEGALYARTGDQLPVWMPENSGQLIQRDEEEKIEHLKDYLTYLIRVSQLFGLETHRQAHVFSKGHAPRRRIANAG